MGDQPAGRSAYLGMLAAEPLAARTAFSRQRAHVLTHDPAMPGVPSSDRQGVVSS